MIVSTMPKGARFLRSVIALAAAGKGNPAEYTRNRYGDGQAALTKAIVAAGDISSGAWGSVMATPEASELTGMVAAQAIIGKVGLRPIPLNVRLVAATSAFTAHWVGRGKPKPLSKMDFEADVLPPMKVAGAYSNTVELIRNMSPEAEAALRNDLTRVCVEALDAAFIDAGNAGIVDVMPASVTNGVIGTASTGNPASDVAALVENFSGDLMAASFVTDPITAAKLALARDAGGSFMFPDASPRGGSVIGMPLIVSRSSPRDSSGGQLALIDGSGIVAGIEGVRMAVSDQATIEMLDDPTNDSTTPTATTMVSMWETNSILVLVEIAANWRVVRDGAVSLVTGADYATAAP